MKILCTGSAGFLGSHIADELCRQGNVVIGADNLSGGFMRNTLDHLCFFIDLRDSHVTERLVSQFQPEILIHACASAREIGSLFEPLKSTEDNIVAYMNTLNACIKYKVKKVMLFSCHDQNTNLVTTKGIKKYTEITKDDLVYSLNQKTQDIEIKSINEIIINKYEGKMLQFSGRANLCVTPNHRMFFVKSPHVSPRLEFEVAEKTFKRSYFKLPVPKWCGINFDENHKLEKNIDRRMKKQPTIINTKDLFYLIGLYVADGSIRKPITKETKTGLDHMAFVCQGKKHGYSGRFNSIFPEPQSQLNFFEKDFTIKVNKLRTYESYQIRYSVPVLDKARKKLEDILKRNNFTYTSYGDGNNIEIKSYGLSKIFKECSYGAHNKHIPDWCLLAGKEYLQELFNGLLDGDGDKKHTVLSTVSKRLVENAIELALKIGLTASFKQYQPSNNTFIKGRLIHSTPYYVVSFGYTEPNMHRRGMKEIDYSGDVWCLNADNNNFLVERNGKICFSGNSMAVYGDQKPPFTENMALMPEDVYGLNKSFMEKTTKVLSEIHGFKYTILRPHNVFGVRQSLADRYRNVFAIWMNRIMHGEKEIYIFGDGNQLRAFSPIEFSLPCYVRCLQPDTDGKIYNIGGIAPITLNEAAEMVIKAMGVEGKVTIKHLPARPNEVKYAWCDCKKSVDELGYKETKDVQTCLNEMSDWAHGLGPQDWTKDKLELMNEKTPEIWR